MSDPLQWSQALEAEVHAIRGGPALGPDAPTDPGERVRAFYREIHKQPTSALCLSGGGIRSGTFALGVLQGLAHLGVLGKFDYLSTVSGGGYVGGWFTAWLHREGRERRDVTIRALDPAQASATTGQIDAGPVDYLRRTCRYLAPTGGAVSADFWTVLATLARNLLLNWFVVLPIIAAALLVPRLFYALTQTFEVREEAGLTGMQCFARSPASVVFFAITLGAAGMAVSYVAAVFAGFGQRWSQARFLGWFLVPVVTGAVASSLFWAAFPCQLNLASVMWMSAGVPAAAWALLALLGRLVRSPGTAAAARVSQIGLRTILAAAVSGPILGAGAYFFAMYSFGFGGGETQRNLYAVFAMPLVFALVLLALTVFVGLASSDLDDPSLEWWSRCAAWIAIAMVLWLGASVLVIYMAKALEGTLGLFEHTLHASRTLSTGIVSALLPLLASLAGLAARSTGATDKPSATRLAVQQIALPLIIVTLLSAIAWANLRGAEALEYHTDLKHNPCTSASSVGDGDCHAAGGGLGEVALLGAACLAFGLLMSYFVPANRFSLHGMYRQRLVRTFLGASRQARAPNPFTGFDGHDDLRVHDLSDVRPLHIVNATLNAVSSTKVGRHETIAQPFTFSPLHVGNRETGYRPSAQYGSDGGGPGTGLSLGLALAVSGAAASPAMGIHSTKTTAFLLTLANARLGLWFGNPSSATSWRNSEPPLGVGPILRELLGLTTDRNPFVYLSDGGHYENLGLWEMVARRCRFIVVSDAGCDPEYGFDDLSNAVRRILLDLGIPVEFAPLPMTKAGQGHGNPHAAIGTIRYSVVDGSNAPDGTILYLKATLSGDEPVDVWNFARTDPAFPHDPTSEQFFDEARFESYRSLGFHTVLKAAPGFQNGQGIDELIATAKATQEQRPAQ